MGWVEYEAGDPEQYVSVDQFGKDHWSTLAYLETCCCDNDGLIKNQHMRCNNRLHRGFSHTVDSDHPTRLKEEELQNHDDWSCVEDFVAAGYVRLEFRQVNDKTFGNLEAKVQLTDDGFDVVYRLRRWKANGRTFGNFQIKEEDE